MKSHKKDNVARFHVNERVLCYEPDLTKARVVYDAKILKVERPESKKSPNPKDFHYLVHFQGWSSTWDRYVTEEFLLKITDENRQMQRKLFYEAEEATHAQRKKNKKKKKRLSTENLSISIDSDSGPPSVKRSKIQPSPNESISSTATSETEASSSVASVSPLITNNQKRLTHRSISQDSAMDAENQTPIKISDELKSILEDDFYRVTKRKTLADLPAGINVASVLEDYVRHYAAISLVNYEKQLSKTYYTANRKETSRELFAKVTQNINMAKEFVDGLRVIFDFNLKSILLYGGSCGESKQYNDLMKPGKHLIKRKSSSRKDSTTQLLDEGQKLPSAIIPRLPICSTMT